jgi:RNA polymerase sigma-70 factor (ECF subfamily)
MRLIDQLDPVRCSVAMPLPFGPLDLAIHADDLRRFARRRVRDEALAEDAVQDTLLSALVSLPGFEGKSSLKTWLLGILAHKINDAFRREVRYVRMAGQDGEEGFGEGGETAEGTAVAEALADSDPLREVCRRRFSASLQAAMAQLPSSLREVFQLQAIEGLETDQVCSQLGISRGNCWVRLHRARKILADQLEDHL